ncbi:glycosyltransferase family 4 protein [Calothrix sp. PCC 6303]|uniref:glycosyltransferase family 4 protein n=1 Tax=Calothrix sp. PCC 6303 TaxID=1170562 RepID=UPI0002A043F1|nr:glycosyltransferase family 4 protein [Calothrix sp. PCC 6303]AFZ01175.1 glycosyl transferase group 1 [Calothrix sp. PCC 6303]
MNNLRIAWLLTAAPSYWHPILTEFVSIFPQTKLFTAKWQGFAKGYEQKFAVEIIGDRKLLELKQNSGGYSNNVMYLSPQIIPYLWKFKPDIIFADGFCLWTIFVAILKLVFSWKIILIYDGSSPSVDYRNSKLRIFTRRRIGKFCDRFITNHQPGKDYLHQVLGIDAHTIFVHPYLVPDLQALLQDFDPHLSQNLPQTIQLQKPIFFSIGQIIPRKGIRELIEACYILQQQGYEKYSLLIAGEGNQRQELDELAKKYNLATNISWLGQVNYSHLGSYFHLIDVFVFPSHEDVWGMVLLEAMSLGKAVIASQNAGSAELIREGDNGYTFNPSFPEELANSMKECMDNPPQIGDMGDRSREIMSQHTPKTSAIFLTDVVKNVIENSVLQDK